MKTSTKIAAGVVATLVGTAFGLYLSIGSLNPCGALHSKARSMLTAAAMNHFDTSSRGATLGSSLGLLLINALPIEGVIDAVLVERFGSAGPLQCTFFLVSADWSDLQKRLNEPRR